MKTGRRFDRCWQYAMELVWGCLRLLLMLLSTKVTCTVRMLTKGRAYFVSPGQQVQFSCEFHTDHFNLFDNPVVWRKTQLDETAQVNMMGNLMEPFESSRRFRVNFIQTPQRYTLRLSISEIYPEDSGNYTCEVNGPLNTILAVSTHCLYVRAPLNELRITADLATDYDVTNVGGDSLPTLAFVENQPRAVRCTARGGYPVPDVALHLDDRDVTDSFLLRHRIEMQVLPLGVTDGSQQQKAMRVVRSVATRLNQSFRVRVDPDGNDGKILQCVATVAGLEPNYTRARIAIHYAPTMLCQQTFAQIGDKSVSVVCEVRAKPEVSAVFWIIDMNGTTVSQGEVINDFWTTMLYREDGVLETRLFLKHAKLESFRHYTLVVENSIAIRTQDVALVQKFQQSTTAVDLPDDSPSVAVGGQAHRSAVVRQVASPLPPLQPMRSPTPRSLGAPQSHGRQVTNGASFLSIRAAVAVQLVALWANWAIFTS